jgi:NADH dehydrogenase
VDGHLRVAGHPEIFVLGDQAAGAPMLAQAATQQAPIVSAAIVSAVSGRPLGPGFSFKPKGLLVSLGRWHAVGEIGRVTVSGPIAWFIWRTVYLLKFPCWRKRIRVAAEWAIGLFFPRDISA